jgi:hypothetical protein
MQNKKIENIFLFFYLLIYLFFFFFETDCNTVFLFFVLDKEKVLDHEPFFLPNNA